MNSPIIAYRGNMGVQTTAPFSNTYSTEYDGIDDYVDTGITTTGTNDVSISCWIKTTETFAYTQSRCAFGGYNNGSGANYTLGRLGSAFSSANDMKVRAFNTLGTTKLNDGNWHNIIYTYDYTTKEVKAYVDGNTTPEVTATMAAWSSNYRIAIGWNGATSSYHFEGNIDECAVWYSILGASDITAIYNSGNPSDLTDLSPIAWYRMGDNGAYKSPQWLIPNNDNKDKVSNYSLLYDGVDDYIDIGNGINFEYTDAFSYSFWVKPDAVSGLKYLYSKYASGRGILIYLNSSSSGGNNTLNFNLYNTNSGTIATRKRIVTNSINFALPNVWTNIVITYDGSGLGSGINFYKNGVAQSVTISYDTLANNTIQVTQNAYISGNNFASSFFPGNQDEFAIYNIELLSGDALAIYNGGEPTTISGALAYYKMGEEANFTSNWLVDNSALSNYSKRSFDFDGIDDYINLGSGLDIFGSDFTISLWAKWGAQTSNSNGLINFAANTNKAVITLGFSSQYGKISFGTGSASTIGILYDCGSGYDDNNWHHIMCTLQGSTRTVFVDGVDISSTGSNSSIGVGSNNDIGNRARSRYFVGNIDEVSIFDSVIPIGDLWDGSGQPIDVSAVSGITNNWRMGEDASFNGTNWTIPDNVGTSNGTSNSMTVDDLVGEAPNYIGGGISSGMTIEDRVGTAPNSDNNALSFNMNLVDRTTDVPT